MKRKKQHFTTHSLFAYILLGDAIFGHIPQWTCIGLMYEPVEPMKYPPHVLCQQLPQKIYTRVKKPDYHLRSSYRRINNTHLQRNVTPAKQRRLGSRIK